jgi:hypothetical protein
LVEQTTLLFLNTAWNLVDLVILVVRREQITGLWKGAGFAQFAGDSKVNMKAKLHQENKANRGLSNLSSLNEKGKI